MTKEQLDEIEKLAEVRLRSGDLLASHLLLLTKEIKSAQSEIARLNQHLNPKSDKNLYEVKVGFVYYAYAKDQIEAESYAQQAMSDSYHTSDAITTEVTHAEWPLTGDWNEFCGVYHDSAEELRVGDILEKLPSWRAR